MIEEGKNIKGYVLNAKDTSTVIIPISQIEEIKYVIKGASIALNTIGAPGLAFLALWIHSMNQFGRAWS